MRIGARAVARFGRSIASEPLADRLWRFSTGFHSLKPTNRENLAPCVIRHATLGYMSTPYPTARGPFRADQIRAIIDSCQDPDVLRRWLRQATVARRADDAIA